MDSPYVRRVFIDASLFIFGKLNRRDLCANFGIGEATATRDISDYRELNPEGMSYLPTRRHWCRALGFCSIYFSCTYDAVQFLNAIKLVNCKSRSAELLDKGVLDERV